MTRVRSLEVMAESLLPDDVVVVEATTGSDRIVSVLERHGIRVIVANTRKLKAISQAKAKTDRLDARTLARLAMAGLLDQVWTPDERTRALRRLTNRRERIVRASTRAKNEAHGVLAAISVTGHRSPTRLAKPAGRGLRSCSSRSMNVSRSTGACARSTSSTARSRRWIARSLRSRCSGQRSSG